MNRAALVVLAALGSGGSTTTCGAPHDPYAPLRLYQGEWILTSGKTGATKVENHCARTGLFFACEQVVDGKVADLVVFLPQGAKGGVEIYRTEALLPDAAAPGPWYALTIDGDQWTYSDDTAVEAGGARKRTLNTFHGHDHISFQIQTSPDGKTWTTLSGGEERRIR